MKYSCTLLAVVLVIWGQSLFAQDPSFTQFYAHRNYLNPALTGLDPGLSFSAISRLQWLRADRGFRTYAATVELQEPYLRSAFGLSLLHNTEGIGNLATTSVGLTYAYTIPGRNNNLHFGLSARWAQKTLDWSKFIFSDQLDPIQGPIYQSSATPGLERISYFDVDFGAVWRFNNNFSIGRGSGSKARSMIGLAVHHLPGIFGSPQLRESFQNLNTVVPPRLTLHMGTIIPVAIFQGGGRELAISPNFKFDIQGENPLDYSQSLKVYSIGAYILYEGFYVGASYQDKVPFPSGTKNTNAFSLMLGGYLNTSQRSSQDDQQFFLGFGVDINTTGLGVAGGNVYELALRYNISSFPPLSGRGRSGSKNRFLDCKDFF